MKLVIASVLGLLVCCGAFFAVAQSTALPKKMTTEHAAKLDRAITHIRDLTQQREVYIREANEIASTYRFKPEDLGRTVGVDFMTGEIVRAPAPVEAPAK